MTMLAEGAGQMQGLRERLALRAAPLAQEEQGKRACHGTPTSQVTYFYSRYDVVE
jgi:hypothetical protein